ncbi:MAG: GIY-YIG nuclease family protein [Candidatus Omnitrophica bacterium]|nr:GIY-YIG nuclease family protein [Candidatus Omnitrophota bacterium]
MFYTYVIKSETIGQYYIGSCSDIDSRLKQHNRGQTKTTKYKGPYKLVYKEEFVSKSEALKREKQIKSYKGGRAFKKLIASPSSSLV